MPEMMKTPIRIALCALVALSLSFGCKKKTKKTDESEDTTIEMTSEEVKTTAVSSQKAADCDEFLDEYEAWMDEYLELLDKHKDNPAALAGTKEFSDMTMKSMEWASQGAQLAMDCASNSSYEKRMKEIQEKSNKRMKEMGFK